MPPGKLRDYGADLTLKKLPRRTVSADSCQQLYQRNGLWCVGLHRRRSGVLGAGVFSWLSGTGDLAASAQFGRITHGTADITRHSARSCAGGL